MAAERDFYFLAIAKKLNAYSVSCHLIKSGFKYLYDPLKIAVNTRLMLSQMMEGIARFSHEILNRMVLAHPNDTFYFIFDRPYDERFIYADNVIPIVLSPPTRHPLIWYYWLEWRIPRLLKRLDADVFLSMDGFTSLNADLPKITVSHDLAFHHYPEYNKWSHRQYFQYFGKRHHDASDHIIAVSKATKQDIINSYDIDQSKISVAYNKCSDRFTPISHQERRQMQERYSDGQPYIMYLGAIHPRKNVSRLVKAFDQYAEDNDDVNLLLVGRWAWKTDDLAKVISGMQHRDRLKVIPKTDDPINQVLAGAEALCYISLLEGFGIPILEAMHCDVPVLTSNVSSMPEVANNAALLVDPMSIDDIAHGISRIVQDKVLRRQLIAAGRIRKDEFSWEESADKIYQKIKMISKYKKK